MQRRELLRQLLHGREQLGNVLRECVQHTDGNHAVQHQRAAAAQNNRHCDNGQEVNRRAENGEHHHFAHARAVEGFVLFLKLGAFLLLTRENLDDPHSRQMLAQKGIQRRDARLDDLVRLAAQFAEHCRQHRHHRYQHERQHCHAEVHHHHNNGKSDDFDDVAEQADNRVGIQVIDRLGVVGDARNDSAHRRQVEEAHGEAFDMRHQLIAQGINDVLPGFLNLQVLQAIADKLQQQNRHIQPRRNQDALKARFRRQILRALLGDVLVNRVADDARAGNVEHRQQPHQHTAQRNRFPVGLDVAHQAQEGVAVIRNVLRLVIPELTPHVQRLLPREVPFPAAACGTGLRTAFRCSAAPRACRTPPPCLRPAQECGRRPEWWKCGALR